MRAIGFGDQIDILNRDNTIRSIITLKALENSICSNSALISPDNNSSFKVSSSKSDIKSTQAQHENSKNKSSFLSNNILKYLSSINSLPIDILRNLRSRRFEIDQEITALEGAPSIASVLRDMKQHHSNYELREAVETGLLLIKNIIMNPKDSRVYRVKKLNPAFHRALGRLIGAEGFMRAIGFVPGANGNITSTGPSDSTTVERNSLNMDYNSSVYYLRTLASSDISNTGASKDAKYDPKLSVDSKGNSKH